MKPSARLVQSYDAPAGDPLGEQIRGRAWTYDSAVTATARAASGDLDGAGALLDVFQEIRRSDGALEGSYDLAGDYGAGPLRSGNQAWVGLAALQWRALTCSGRHDRLIAGVARWLLDHRVSERRSPGFGLVQGGPDVSWASTEHNLEARAFFAGLDATLAGRPCGSGARQALPARPRRALRHRGAGAGRRRPRRRRADRPRDRRRPVRPLGRRHVSAPGAGGRRPAAGRAGARHPLAARARPSCRCAGGLAHRGRDVVGRRAQRGLARRGWADVRRLPPVRDPVPTWCGWRGR